MDMKKLAVFATILVASAAYAGDTLGDDIARLQTSSTVLEQVMTAPDRGIPDKIMESAKCIGIVPSMLKAGFIFGANYGKGVATCRTGKGWSAPVFFRVTGGSWGLQLGGQASDLVLIIRTDDGMQHLLSSKFKMGGDASAAAGPVGRDAQASTDLTLRAQILTYSRARGLFAGVSLAGNVVHQDAGDTEAFYKKEIPFRTILSGGVPVPADAAGFVNIVEKYAPTPPVFPAIASGSTPAAPRPAATPAAVNGLPPSASAVAPAASVEPASDPATMPAADTNSPPAATPAAAPATAPPITRVTPATSVPAAPATTTQAAAAAPAGNQ
jgi:lipid-binding SYLF domain-containing protein